MVRIERHKRSPDADGRVLVMQLTTSAGLSGTLPVQIFENGDGTNDLRKTFTFDGVGTFNAEGEGSGGTGGNACGCTDDSATNFDPDADYDDDNCEYAVLGCTDATACNYNADATKVTAHAWNWMSVACVAVTALLTALATATATVRCRLRLRRQLLERRGRRRHV